MATNNHALKSKKWPIVATLVTLVAVVIMFALGFWQLERANNKELRLTQIEQRQQRSQISLQALTTIESDFRDIKFNAGGELLSDQLFLLDNRINKGRVGYEILVPLKTEIGLLMVNMGWVPAGATRQNLPVINLPKGTFSLSGIAATPDKNPMITETAEVGQSWPVVIQQMDFEVFQSFLNAPVLDFVMLLDEEQELGFVRNWQPVVMPPEKHLAYAIQWFGLALACLLVYIFALKKRYSSRHD